MATHTAWVAQDRNKSGEECSIARRVGRFFGIGRGFRGIQRKREPQGSDEGQDKQARDAYSNDHASELHTASVRRMGKRRIRLPVTANNAFAIAGAAQGTP